LNHNGEVGSIEDVPWDSSLTCALQDEGRCDVTFGELPHDHRGGILMQVEGGCYQVTHFLPAYSNRQPGSGVQA